MYEAFSRRFLRVLRVPHEPESPWGAPGSVRVFRAGRNYFRLRLWLWRLRQGFVLAVFLVSVAAFHGGLHTLQSVIREPGRQIIVQGGPNQEQLRSLATTFPPYVHAGGILIEVLAFAAFIAQIPIGYALLRLDFEQRWYIVTDRSLRLRMGVMVVREMTMSFANIQQVSVTQGPLQRLLRLADVRVESAGGSQAPRGGHGGVAKPSLHTGIFHAVDNAEQVRDLIVERLRVFRDSGLGEREPQESSTSVDQAPPSSRVESKVQQDAAVVAALELLNEARALRSLVESEHFRGFPRHSS